MSTLHIQLLGEFRLTVGAEQPIPIGQLRQRALLTYLLLHRHTPQARRQVAFLFWPDTAEAQAHTNLRQLLHHLRRTWPGVGDFVQIESHTLQWKGAILYELDIALFEQAWVRAEEATRLGDATGARTAFAAALTRYTGDLLPGCYDEWLLAERERLRQCFLDAAEQLVLLCETQRDYAAAIHYAQRLLRADPLHETTYRRLMRLYALNHDRTGALRTYHICTATLARELGVEPHQETQEAYSRLLKLETPVVLRPRAAFLSTGGERLIGRQAAWAKLQAAWQIASRGRAHVVCISGEAGIGKTRLAEELLNWARHQGIAQARTRSYAAEGSLAYAPVTEWLRADVFQLVRKQAADLWLREVARLLPELLVERPTLSAPEPLVERWQRQRFFEALARTILASPQPLLLLLDDLQWCDQETLEWLAYLLRFDARARLLIIGTVRPEELDNEHPLLPLLANLRITEQLTELELAPLDETDTAALARQVASQTLDPGLLANLVQASEGNPLFIVESVRASLNQQPVTGEGRAAASLAAFHTLPPKVHAVIHARLAQLSPAARALAQLAATIGRAFTFEVVAEAGGSEEEALVHSLDELWRRRIVREQSANTYDFSHDRIRDVAYNEISSAQRRLLHKRVARALVTLHASNLAVISGQVGFHYEQALQFEDAVTFYRLAADQAEALYVFERVIFYLQKVVTLLQDLPITADSVQQQLKCWLKVAEVLIITKGWATPERKQALEQAYVLVKQGNDELLIFDVLAGLRGYYGNIGDWDTSYRLSVEQLQIAQKHQDRQRLFRAYHSMGNVYLTQGEFLAALHCYQQAMQLEIDLEPTAHRNTTSNIRVAEALWLCGYPAQAQQVAAATLRMVDEAGHPFGRIHVREFMWYTYERLGDEPTMRRLATELNELCERFGMPDYGHSARFFGGLFMVRDSAVAAGLQQMTRALAGLQQIGNRFNRAYFFALLAQAQAQSGEIQLALHTLATAQQIAEASGEQLWQAELVRLTGDYHRRSHGDAKIVESYYHSALQITRRQGAKSLELRAAMSLAQLWQIQGRPAEARTLLAEIYDWFTEGFDTADLQEAQAVLTELERAI